MGGIIIGLWLMVGYFPVTVGLLIACILLFIYLENVRKTPMAMRYTGRFAAVVFFIWFLIIEIFFVPQFRM